VRAQHSTSPPTKQHNIFSPTDTYVLLRAFVDELARCGMRDACTSPGSRSTPLVLSLASDPRLRCHSHIDERCAGFFALGLAKASQLPVAVTCTSGTALAELLPAAVEAHEAGVPLLILSADRPPELRESGAGQTIDQVKLFGSAAKWFFDVGTHELGDTDATSAPRLRWMRTLACRAYWRALEGRPGIVHLNFALREPLVIGDEPLPPDGSGRRDGAPYVRRAPGRLADPEAMQELRALIAGARRGVLIAGRHERATPLGTAAAAFCETAGWPLLADPLAGARRGNNAVAHYDALLRDPSFSAASQPDLVLRVGDLPTSKPLREWLAGLDAMPQVQLDPEGSWQDPAAVLARSLALEPAHALSTLAHEPGVLAGTDPDWLGTWRSADERAAEAILGVLAASGLSEPVVAAELGVLLPAQATLFVASSMPVRDIETFWPVRPDPPRVLCNRGANGIDGTVSSALGAAAASVRGESGPVVLLIGDVALAHDIGGLIAARRLELPLTIVLLDNDGGGIFDFLPVAADARARAALATSRTSTPRASRGTASTNDAPAEPRADASSADAHPDREDLYTRHILTPTGLDFAHAAQLYGLRHEPVVDVASFRSALERALSGRPTKATIIEVHGERAANVALHRRVWAAVAETLTNKSV
jgi:2-succinyl-5-enolpyruvyl-6-hydroxy-3-cyclohexene-1-carboxylate synthase